MGVDIKMYIYLCFNLKYIEHYISALLADEYTFLFTYISILNVRTL
jgi:hypothetical protein